MKSQLVETSANRREHLSESEVVHGTANKKVDTLVHGAVRENAGGAENMMDSVDHEHQNPGLPGGTVGDDAPADKTATPDGSDTLGHASDACGAVADDANTSNHGMPATDGATDTNGLAAADNAMANSLRDEVLSSLSVLTPCLTRVGMLSPAVVRALVNASPPAVIKRIANELFGLVELGARRVSTAEVAVPRRFVELHDKAAGGASTVSTGVRGGGRS